EGESLHPAGSSRVARNSAARSPTPCSTEACCQPSRSSSASLPGRGRSSADRCRFTSSTSWRFCSHCCYSPDGTDMIVQAFNILVHLLLLLSMPPLLLGVINKTKAWFAGRTGPPVLQPYFDLIRLMQK